MAVELDELDLRIVHLLLKDARTPAAQIAEQIGLSRPAVADQLDKLERQGVIRGMARGHRSDRDRPRASPRSSPHARASPATRGSASAS
jgi:predicted ArsR family transcriptional regulator